MSLQDVEAKLEDPGEEPAIHEYVKDPLRPDADAECQSSIFIVMLKHYPFHLAVISKSPDLRQFSTLYLTGSGASSLNLTRIEDGKKFGSEDPASQMDYYAQDTSIATRKTV